MADTYYTIQHEGEGIYKEKMSKFISFAFHVSSTDEAKDLIKQHQNIYHDARHVCWAYVLGPDKATWQLNDNGEPSGTAGKPILGQIHSFDLTDVLVIVVRYFGGIKLGTPGLIAAYREAARLALENAGKKEMHQMDFLKFSFPYVVANDVMKIIKSEDIEVLDRNFDTSCEMSISFRMDDSNKIRGRILNISGVSQLD